MAPPYFDRSILVESIGQPSVMKSHAMKPPASHGFRWLGRRSTLRSVSADRSGSAVRKMQPSRLSVCSDVSAERSGRAVRDLQNWRSSVCSDVSAERSGSAVRDSQ